MKTSTTANGDTVWSFSRAELAALLAFASTDETRAAISGVLLDTEHQTAVATDGHRLAKVTTSYSLAKERAVRKMSIVPRGLLARAVKAARRSDEIRVTPNCTRVDVGIHEPQAPKSALFQTTAATVLSGVLTDAQYPPYEQVVPQAAETATMGVGLSAAYLADVLLVAQAAECEGVALAVGPDALSPVKLTAVSQARSTEWIAVIMPMRI